MPAGRNITVKPESNEIFIESDKPISVAFVDYGIRGKGENTYGAVTYVGVSSDETVYVYVPLSTSQESYVFAYKDGTVVTIDELSIKLDADQFFPLTSGLHEVKATENVLIQIVYWPRTPEMLGISRFGVVVPAVETLDLEKTVELQPVLEEETTTTTYIYAAVAVVVIAAAVVAYYMKFKKVHR